MNLYQPVVGAQRKYDTRHPFPGPWMSGSLTRPITQVDVGWFDLSLCVCARAGCLYIYNFYVCISFVKVFTYIHLYI
jgi:hypothetical protein